MNKRIFITGISGFVGSHLARHLGEKNLRITLQLVKRLSTFRPIDASPTTLCSFGKHRRRRVLMTPGLQTNFFEAYHLAALSD
jgi:nucleoside-diphosphate-sugar epimerase